MLEAGAARVVRLQAGMQRVLPGVAKRGVAQVVRQRNGFDQVFIELQVAGDGAAKLATSSECVSRVRNRSPS